MSNDDIGDQLCSNVFHPNAYPNGDTIVEEVSSIHSGDSQVPSQSSAFNDAMFDPLSPCSSCDSKSIQNHTATPEELRIEARAYEISTFGSHSNAKFTEGRSSAAGDCLFDSIAMQEQWIDSEFNVADMLFTTSHESQNRANELRQLVHDYGIRFADTCIPNFGYSTLREFLKKENKTVNGWANQVLQRKYAGGLIERSILALLLERDIFTYSGLVGRVGNNPDGFVSPSQFCERCEVNGTSSYPSCVIHLKECSWGILTENGDSIPVSTLPETGSSRVRPFRLLFELADGDVNCNHYRPLYVLSPIFSCCTDNGCDCTDSFSASQLHQARSEKLLNLQMALEDNRYSDGSDSEDSVSIHYHPPHNGKSIECEKIHLVDARQENRSFNPSTNSLIRPDDVIAGTYGVWRQHVPRAGVLVSDPDVNAKAYRFRPLACVPNRIRSSNKFSSSTSHNTGLFLPKFGTEIKWFESEKDAQEAYALLSNSGDPEIEFNLANRSHDQMHRPVQLSQTSDNFRDLPSQIDHTLPSVLSRSNETLDPELDFIDTFDPTIPYSGVTFKYVHNALVTAYRGSLRFALKMATSDISVEPLRKERGHKLMFLLSRMFFSKPPGKSHNKKSTMNELRTINGFALNHNYDGLYKHHLGNVTKWKKKSKPGDSHSFVIHDDAHRDNIAHENIANGDLSRAMTNLHSNGIAKPGEITNTTMASMQPKAKAPIPKRDELPA